MTADKVKALAVPEVKDLSREKGITFAVEHITPKIAAYYMTKNSPTQRRIRSATIAKYVQDLKNGLWQLNGEPIVFSKSGVLLNGQHRLRSIIMSGVPADIVVIRGVSDDTTVFDVPARRTSADRSRLSEKDLHPSALAAANVIVGMFSVVGVGMEDKYANEHADELRRAYHACCQGMPGKKSLKASCVLAAYLMLRTKTLQFHDLDVFFQVFNGANPSISGQEYDVSPAIIASKMFDTMGTTPVRRTRTQLEILILALEDFTAKKERKIAYVIGEEEHWKKYAEMVRKEDGLDG